MYYKDSIASIQRNSFKKSVAIKEEGDKSSRKVWGEGVCIYVWLNDEGDTREEEGEIAICDSSVRREKR